MTKTIICTQCDGLGWLDSDKHGGLVEDCQACSGNGKVPHVKINPVPAHDYMVKRLVNHFNSATDRDISQGEKWYDAAREIAEALAIGTGYTVEQTASVIAVLSPNVAWDENVNSALLAVEGHFYHIPHTKWRGAGYGENKSKASDILDGDLTRLRGPKVTNFARGILGDTEACTIDLWMLRSIGCEDTMTVTPKRWTAINAAIREAATECGYDTRTFQAIVWSKVRNETLAKNTKHAWRVA
jgi:hypothetical protein